MSLGNNEWRTDDTSLAAFLVYRGYIVLRTGWRRRTCEWYFLEDDNLVDEVFDYLAGTTKVEPRAYMEAYVNLKKKMLRDRPSVESQR